MLVQAKPRVGVDVLMLENTSVKFQVGYRPVFEKEQEKPVFSWSESYNVAFHEESTRVVESFDRCAGGRECRLHSHALSLGASPRSPHYRSTTGPVFGPIFGVQAKNVIVFFHSNIVCENGRFCKCFTMEILVCCLDQGGAGYPARGNESSVK